MRCKHLDLNFEGSETVWWCREKDKYASHKDCTILPCKPSISLGGCERAELDDRVKIQLEEAKGR